MQYLEAVFAKRNYLVQCSIPTINLQNSFPNFNSSDFHDHKVLALMVYLMKSQFGRFNLGVFKREFGLKALLMSVMMDWLKFDEKMSILFFIRRLDTGFCPRAIALYTTCENW